MARQSPGAVRLLALNGAISRDAAAQTAINRAWGLRFADAQEMLEWADLAVELAESPQLCAQSHAHRGNALRISGRFEDARREFDLASQIEGCPEVLLLEFRASLFENLSDFGNALACLRSAGRLRAQDDDPDGQAKLQAHKGHVLTEAGHHLEAALAFRQALETVQEDWDVARTAVHGLAHALARSGQPHRALAVLKKARPMIEQGSTLYQLRVEWLLGRIAMVCDSDAIAVASLEAAHHGFAEQHLCHETCLTALDLAVHHARSGRPTTAHDILAPVPELLTEIGVDSEAEIAAALRLLLEGEIARAVVHLDRVISAIENST
jgi:tetratricopeptide (TPR) repeat protein